MKLVENDPLADYQATIEAACKLLPAWFVGRMMSDEWSFGMLLTTGHTICLSNIMAVHQAADGSIWIDATMQDNDGMVPSSLSEPFLAPTSRLHVSINAATIVAAFELADT